MRTCTSASTSFSVCAARIPVTSSLAVRTTMSPLPSSSSSMNPRNLLPPTSNPISRSLASSIFASCSVLRQRAALAEVKVDVLWVVLLDSQVSVTSVPVDAECEKGRIAA